MRLTRLRLSNWRNFSRIDIALAGRVILVGPNASGKSNLLDAIRFLHDLASVGGGFQESVRKRGGVPRLRSLSARQKTDITIEIHLGTEEFPEEWTYEISFNQDSARRAVLKREVVRRKGNVIHERPDTEDRKDPERCRQTYLEQVNANKDFRDIALFLQSLRYLHVVPQLIREPERSVGRLDDPFGGDLLEQIARIPEKTRMARLRRIRDALKVAVPQLIDLELWRDERGTAHLRGRYSHWRLKGAWQTENDFSDGTLRLMGILWAVLDGQGPILFEEPELSLHPEVVRHIPQMFARLQRKTGRQIFISTHSEEMLRDEGIGLDEVFLLIPGHEGTMVRAAEKLREVRTLLEGGLSLAESILPKIRPEGVEQLALFGDRSR